MGDGGGAEAGPNGWWGNAYQTVASGAGAGGLIIISYYVINQ